MSFVKTIQDRMLPFEDAFKNVSYEETMQTYEWRKGKPRDEAIDTLDDRQSHFPPCDLDTVCYYLHEITSNLSIIAASIQALGKNGK